MLSAVKSNKNAVLGNTTVKSNNKGVFVYLYDTIIFAKVRAGFTIQMADTIPVLLRAV